MSGTGTFSKLSAAEQRETKEMSRGGEEAVDAGDDHWNQFKTLEIANPVERNRFLRWNEHFLAQCFFFFCVFWNGAIDEMNKWVPPEIDGRPRDQRRSWSLLMIGDGD